MVHCVCPIRTHGTYLAGVVDLSTKMEFLRKKKSKSSKISDKYDSYRHALQLYSLPPTDNVTLQEFEQFAVDRLLVLQAVETVGIRTVKGSPEYITAFKKELANIKSSTPSTRPLIPRSKDSENLTNEDFEDRRRDHISHFILRLAYCKTEELRRWFIAQEVDLFRYRFGQETKTSISNFLEVNGLSYKPIAEEEKSLVSDELSQAAHGALVENINYYKVPFTEALDLVKQRRVFLKNGFAYVPQNDLVVIILSVYRTNLSHALTIASRALPQLEEDGRLLPMLSGLSKRYLGQDYNAKKPTAGVVTADMIDGLSAKSFPLCMQHVHQSLRTHHHLKHWGRMQYGLFLKAIGVSLDEAMKFWRAEFCKMVDPDKFEKSYAYNIRHNYGKEGKRADYTPYSCIKIITSNAPGPGDHHGCPFRHFDSDLLQQRLQSKGFPKEDLSEIISLVKSHHFQLACGKYFEMTHKVSTNYNPNHPNQYYDESQKILNGERPLEDVTGSSQNRVVKIVPSQSQKSQNTSVLSTQKQDEVEDDFADDIPLDLMEEM